jgi:hypothetical protein
MTYSVYLRGRVEPIRVTDVATISARKGVDTVELIADPTSKGEIVRATFLSGEVQGWTVEEDGGRS